MEYRRGLGRAYGSDNGNYVVVITSLFAALGLAYGISQIVGSNPIGAASVGDTILLALAAGGVWGVIGLVFGAMISALINGGFWSIPIILVLALAFQSTRQ